MQLQLVVAYNHCNVGSKNVEAKRYFKLSFASPRTTIQNSTGDLCELSIYPHASVGETFGVPSTEFQTFYIYGVSRYYMKVMGFRVIFHRL